MKAKKACMICQCVSMKASFDVNIPKGGFLRINVVESNMTTNRLYEMSIIRSLVLRFAQQCIILLLDLST